MKTYPLVLFLLLITCSASLEGKLSEYTYLDKIALAVGTDKSSAGHDYTRVYANYFSPFKNEQLKFLEIGIYKGQSVQLWENYFKKAELHFIDLTPAHIIYNSKRSRYHFLDQGNASDLQNFLKVVGKDFDIIIDDGGHLMDQQIISFINLFPALKSGGMYVIEDLHTSYNRAYGGGGDYDNPKASPLSATEFLKQLVDEVNYTGARCFIANHEKTPKQIRDNLNYFQENILSLHFYKSLCFIIKR